MTRCPSPTLCGHAGKEGELNLSILRGEQVRDGKLEVLLAGLGGCGEAMKIQVEQRKQRAAPGWGFK